ncbi:MAG TPA: beta-propeller fold lactonase family protein, partial [Terriglobales bacterium]|nr:beta-propeller fold lactonase family protein [Terriglobales bacterium]
AFLNTYRADDMGALTQLGSMTLKTGGAAEIGVDPTGKFLYGTADVFAPGQSFVEPAILAFSIDQNSGKLTELPGSPYFLGGGMFTTSKPVFTPNGAWVCLSLELGRTNEGAICYPRHADGSVDGKNFFSAGGSDTGISDIVCSSDSSAVFFTNGQQNQVRAGSIGTSSLRAFSSGGSFASGLALSPSGHWLVVANRDSSNLSVIEAGGGSLAPTFNTAKTGTNPSRVAYSRDGTYIFVTTKSGTIVYTQDRSTGTLTPLNLSNPAPGIDGEIATM